MKKFILTFIITVTIASHIQTMQPTEDGFIPFPDGSKIKPVHGGTHQIFPDGSIKLESHTGETLRKDREGCSIAPEKLHCDDLECGQLIDNNDEYPAETIIVRRPDQTISAKYYLNGDMHFDDKTTHIGIRKVTCHTEDFLYVKIINKETGRTSLVRWPAQNFVDEDPIEAFIAKMKIDNDHKQL